MSTMIRLRTALLLILLAFAVPSLHAHIGSPDTFVEAHAGPYRFLLAAHPPSVYPGALELDFRFSPDDHITTVADSIDDNHTRSDIQVLVDGTTTTSIWLSTPEAHTIALAVQGSSGTGTYTLALPPAPVTRNAFAWDEPRFLWLVFFLEGLIIIATRLAVRNRKLTTRGSILIILAAAVLFIIIGWWTNRPVKQTTVTATLADHGQLTLMLSKSGEAFTDLVPDHGRILHLFLIRQPQDNVFLHLHPERLAPNKFQVTLPSMPPGTYQLFADYYHSDGRGETSTITLDLPSQQGTHANTPDDSTAVLPPMSHPNSTGALHLPDGYQMQLQIPAQLHALQAVNFTVTLLDPAGQAPNDMALYLGMPAHAVILRTDAPDPSKQVFAHIHPGGTLPMLMPANADGSMPGMVMPATTNTATIPYGFPTPGHYRIFVQMKHGSIIETGAFDVAVQ